MLSLVLLLPAAALAAGDVAAGRKIAETWCVHCHVIETAKPHGGIDSTPTFFLINDQLGDYRPRLRRRDHSTTISCASRSPTWVDAPGWPSSTKSARDW